MEESPPIFENAGTSTATVMDMLLRHPFQSLQYTYHHALKYLQRNAWTIVFMVAGIYLVKNNFIDPFVADYRKKQTYREATDPKRVSALTSDMRRVRAAQQEEAQRKALEAEELRQMKQREEMERRRIETPEEMRMGKTGRKLGTGEKITKKLKSKGDGDGEKPSSSSYNPMDPSSGSTRGYRAARRAPRRG